MVRTRLLNLLLLAAVVLAVSRLWQFQREPAPALPAINAGTTPSAEALASRDQKPGVAEFRPEAYDVIVARDLFSPSRGVVPPAPTAAAMPAPKPQPAPKLTLYGVVMIDGDKSAYLQEGTQEGRPRKVREQESFAGGVVKAIRPDGVTFVFAGSEIAVPLRSPKDGGVVPSPGGQNTGSAPPQPQAPVAFPRRRTPTAVQQGTMTAPGRPVNVRPGMPMVAPGIRAAVPPPEPTEELFQDEEFPESSLPGEEEPVLMEEEPED